MNRHRPFSLGGGNGSKCPHSDIGPPTHRQSVRSIDCVTRCAVGTLRFPARRVQWKMRTTFRGQIFGYRSDLIKLMYRRTGLSCGYRRRLYPAACPILRTPTERGRKSWCGLAGGVAHLRRYISRTAGTFSSAWHRTRLGDLLGLRCVGRSICQTRDRSSLECSASLCKVK